MLTVLCVFVRGPFPYTAEYVVRLRRMVARYLRRPHRFLCLTDRPDELPTDVERIQVPSLGSRVPDNGRGYWAKIQCFNPALGLVGRVLYLDLDTLVVRELDAVVDYPSPFALTEDALAVERAHLDRDRFGRRLIRRFNSSVMVWMAGPGSRPCDRVYHAWTPDVAQRLSTDQDWIAEQVPSAAAMPLAWFPRISRTQPPWPNEARVVLVKKPKNQEAVTRWPWFDAAWGGWAA